MELSGITPLLYGICIRPVSRRLVAKYDYYVEYVDQPQAAGQPVLSSGYMFGPDGRPRIVWRYCDGAIVSKLTITNKAWSCEYACRPHMRCLRFANDICEGRTDGEKEIGTISFSPEKRDVVTFFSGVYFYDGDDIYYDYMNYGKLLFRERPDNIYGETLLLEFYAGPSARRHPQYYPSYPKGGVDRGAACPPDGPQYCSLTDD